MIESLSIKEFWSVIPEIWHDDEEMSMTPQQDCCRNQYPSVAVHIINIMWRRWIPRVVLMIPPKLFDKLELELYNYRQPNMHEIYFTRHNLVTKSIDNWCKENCKGKVKVNNGFWLEFQRKDDAMKFKMIWSCYV